MGESKIFIAEEDFISEYQMFDEMSQLERALHSLRPLVLESDNWDYFVVWKLGDDPSRLPFLLFY